MKIKQFILNIIPVFLFIFTIFIFSGCTGDKNIVAKNMADLRTSYFVGSCDDFVVDLSCGYREKNFAYDGVAGEAVECGVLGLAFKSAMSYSKLVVSVDINGEKQNVTLERSPFENKYMADLEKIIDGDIKVALKNGGEYVTLLKVSADFNISYEKALEIGLTHFSEAFEKLYSGGNLNCECYLKIVAKQDFGNIYWFFSYIDRAGNSEAILIDTQSGEVLAETVG